MTEIEAKALAHSLRSRAKYYRSRSDMDAIMDAGLMGQAVTFIETTEARHAAEMRELKERFSEAAHKATQAAIMSQPAQAASYLAPFIIPAPDPLVEAWQMAFPGNHIEDARDECAKISAAIEKRGGKIVWEAGE